MTVPDESDRASTVEVHSLNATKVDEEGSECLEVETQLLGLNTVDDDKNELTILVPADGKTRSKKLDEALADTLLISGGIKVALTVADEPATTLDELLEVGRLDDALVGITNDVLAVLGDTEKSAEPVGRVDGPAVADDGADAAVVLHVEETSVGGNGASVLLRSDRSGCNTGALIVRSVNVEGLTSTLDGESVAGDSLADERLLQNLVSKNLELTTSGSSSDIITGEVAKRRFGANIASSDNASVERKGQRQSLSNCHSDSKQNDELHPCDVSLTYFCLSVCLDEERQQ